MGLVDDVVRHVVAVVDTVALAEHVLGLGVISAVLVDVGANVGQQVRPVAGMMQRRAEPGQVLLVGSHLFAD